MWTDRQQTAFEALKACLVHAPILGFPTEDGHFVLDTDASLFAVRGVLSQLQKKGEVVIAYASRSLRLSQRMDLNISFCSSSCSVMSISSIFACVTNLGRSRSGSHKK